MFTLPDVVGSYPVGATTFAIPVAVNDEAARVTGQARLKSSSGGTLNTPALKLEEVAFTAYYPADPHYASNPSRKLPKRMHWIARLVTACDDYFASISHVRFALQTGQQCPARIRALWWRQRLAFERAAGLDCTPTQGESPPVDVTS